MRFIHFYLIAYFILVAGAGLALWRAGVFNRVSGLQVTLAAVIVVGLGITLAVTSPKHTTVGHE